MLSLISEQVCLFMLLFVMLFLLSLIPEQRFVVFIVVCDVVVIDTRAEVWANLLLLLFVTFAIDLLSAFVVVILFAINYVFVL